MSKAKNNDERLKEVRTFFKEAGNEYIDNEFGKVECGEKVRHEIR